MARQDQERQKKLEPLRMKNAREAIEKKGYMVSLKSETTLMFTFKDVLILYFPYSGWATGATIKDGRGLKKLLMQI